MQLNKAVEGFYFHVGKSGGTVAWWLARLPHTSRVGGSIPASVMCVEFACSPRALGVSSRYSGFLPRSKDMHCRLIGISKLSVVCE
ncbi:hypothetical protein QTP70_026968 [Hemibagrus guttatus]|uniref:Uncharacterized protein n=1 Tax=Hemibagrus guttatus TaxID=175788 RepID=A0AAE0UVE6_9TELE|nr:hypothetical protein QTP70_026968 [Hemibagrus guttatus]